AKPQQAKARVEAKALRSKAPERSSSAKSAVKVKSKTVQKTTRPAAAKPAPKAAPRVVAEPKQQLALPAKAAKPGKEQAQDKSKAAEQARAIAKLRALRAQQGGAEAVQRTTATRGARDRGARPGLEGARPLVQVVDAETRRMRLKNLIVLGKERGYLTYAEINDHLPDDMLDAEQIESVISMINDMGIQVYDEAPDAETLLMSDAATQVADEDVAEEAEQALSNVDAEFGRTTDPVRMYMREMGSVELLTREGEIEIAKRIEEGLKHMVQAISACPTTIAEILKLADRIARDELRVDEVVDGLIDPDAEDEDELMQDVGEEDVEDIEE